MGATLAGLPNEPHRETSMAGLSRTNVRQLITSRRSLAATLILSCLSWACRSDAPTSIHDVRATTASRSAVPSARSQLIPGQYIVAFADTVSDAAALAKK